MKIIITIALLMNSLLMASTSLEEAYRIPYIFENAKTNVTIGDKKLELTSEIIDTGIKESKTFEEVIPFIQQGSIKIFQNKKEILKLNYEKYYDKDLNLLRTQTMTSKNEVITCKIISDKNKLPEVIIPGFITKVNVMECDNNTKEESMIIFKNKNEIVFYSKTSMNNKDNKSDSILEERTRTLYMKYGLIKNVSEKIISNNLKIEIDTEEKAD